MENNNLFKLSITASPAVPEAGLTAEEKAYYKDLQACYEPLIGGPHPLKVAKLRAGDIELCAEQRQAIHDILYTDKSVVILTGLAGTGKSVVIDALREHYPVAVCATTARAALNVRGCTVDAMFSMNRDGWTTRSPSRLNDVMYNIPRIVLLDEASMVGLNMGNYLAEAVEYYGKKLVMVCDYGQALPVKDKLIIGSALVEDPLQIRLVENHRQGEGVYLGALNALHDGRVTDEAAALFKGRVQRTPPDDDSWLRMYATNRKTNAYNRKRLHDHCMATRTNTFLLEASVEDKRAEGLRERFPLDAKRSARMLDDSRMAHGESFAVGCRIQITYNNGPVVNGDTGTLIRAVDAAGKDVTPSGNLFEDDTKAHTLAIKLDRTDDEVVITKQVQEITDAKGTVEYAVRGFPIRLGYAVTIHRAQGMTVPKAWVDIGSITHFPKGSRHGLAYVGLSRTKTQEGLLLSKWDPEAIEVCEELRPLL